MLYIKCLKTPCPLAAVSPQYVGRAVSPFIPQRNSCGNCWELHLSKKCTTGTLPLIYFGDTQAADMLLTGSITSCICISIQVISVQEPRRAKEFQSGLLKSL